MSKRISELPAAGALDGTELVEVSQDQGSAGLVSVQTTTQDIANLSPGGGSTQGKQSMWVPAGAIRQSEGNGCAPLVTVNIAANQPDIQTLDFDGTTQEFAQFAIAMPKKWNEGTLTFKAYWSHASGASPFGVVWQLQAVAFSDDDNLAAAFGTAQTSTDAGGTANDIYISPESSAITVAGAPTAEDLVYFRIARAPGDSNDTMGQDARLHGIVLYYTTDADTDA